MCFSIPSERCTLRAAIQQANASGGATTINLPSGTYILSLAGTDDTAQAGDLDITSNITIIGTSATAVTIIDGNSIDRVFDVVSSTVTISSVMIRNGSLGGMRNSGNSSLTLNNTAVSNNGGPGIFNLGTSSLTLNNSTVSTNNGSGINNLSTGLIKLSYVTISGNIAPQGGGIFVGSGTFLLKNTILAGNTDQGGGGPDCFGIISSLGNNVLGSSSNCSGFGASGDLVDVADPKLGSLTYNGGASYTHALLAGSPAINAASDTSTCRDQASNPLTSDQRGTTRPQGGRCDIGAYEVPAVRFGNSGVFSVGEVGPTALIMATLEGASAYTVTVNYATGNGTATAGSDYTAKSGTLTFAPFDPPKTFTVPITNDTVFEGDQTVLLTLSDAVSATLGSPSTATLTIVDNDPQPTVQFNPGSYTVNETGTAAITVILSSAAERPITVTYSTSNGTAIAGNDYTATSGALAFAPLQTSKPINVTIIPDTSDEPDETFTVLLSNPLSVTIAGTNPVTVTILDDDLPQFFLPLVMNKHSKFFTGLESEDNDRSSQANGPLGSSLTPTISGRANDNWDFFYFDSTEMGTISVSLPGYNNTGHQLQLYYESTGNNGG